MLSEEEMEILVKAKLIAEKQKQMAVNETEKEKKVMYDKVLTALQEERNTYLSQLQNIDEIVEAYKQQTIANLQSKIATVSTTIAEMGTFNGQCLHLKTSIKHIQCFEAYDGSYKVKYCTTCGKYLCEM